MKLKLAFGVAILCAAFVAGCSQPQAPAQAQTPPPEHPRIVNFDFRPDGRKIALVEDPGGQLRLCELRGGEELRWDCTDLPPV